MIKLSPLLISKGTYLENLVKIENILPELLQDETRWQSLDIDYEMPRVERLWLQHDSLRICLHKIHPSSTPQSFLHPHPWPSAMRILSGKYEMGVGVQSLDSAPLIASTIHLETGSSYEMITPHGLHYVNPIGGITYSLMVSGTPWPGLDKKSGFVLKPLTQEAKREILHFF